MTDFKDEIRDLQEDSQMHQENIWRLSCRDVDLNPELPPQDMPCFGNHDFKASDTQPNELFSRDVWLDPPQSTGSHPSNNLYPSLSSS
jgi:hypothetical protein